VIGASLRTPILVWESAPPNTCGFVGPGPEGVSDFASFHAGDTPGPVLRNAVGKPLSKVLYSNDEMEQANKLRPEQADLSS